MNPLAGISPYVYRCGRTVRNLRRKRYTVSSENCNVFIFCTKGTAIHEVGSRKRLLTAGTAEIIPPFQHQVIRTITDTDTEIFYLYFDLFERRTVKNGNEKPIRSDVPMEEMYFIDQPAYKNMESQYEEVRQLIEKMESSFRSDDPFAALGRKTVMLQLLHAFLLAEAVEEAKSVPTASGHVARSMRYIERHCSEVNLCAKTVAAYVGLDETYLSKLFHGCIHMSLSKYIRCTRVNRAKELFYLNKRVAEVSGLCGFTSVQSFCRTFKQIEGITPSQYIHSIA